MESSSDLKIHFMDYVQHVESLCKNSKRYNETDGYPKVIHINDKHELQKIAMLSLEHDTFKTFVKSVSSISAFPFT